MKDYFAFFLKDYKNSVSPVRNFIRLAVIFLLLFISSFSLSLAQEEIPVTHLRFNDDTNKLQFAIVSDLWGGYRVGVFEDAVRKLELLQPQFVMSVGDMISGMTNDSTLVDREWDEFNKMVHSLSMPFFYVPGNHDISNPLMEKVWKKRIGSTYYYFIRKNVLFLIIDTQDGGTSNISPEQIAYFGKVINDHPDVRWTFIFMHRPVWEGEGDHEEGFEKIEEVLQGARYTLFSGHHHSYVKIVKNGYNHYVLSSTGARSSLRGVKYGEFDHIMWVTLKDNKAPKIINITLDGLVKNNVVNENTFPITTTLTKGTWLITPKFVAQDTIIDSIRPFIVFNNPTYYPLKVTGDFSYLSGYTVNPPVFDLVIPPHDKIKKFITIKSAGGLPTDLSALPYINIKLYGSFKYKGGIYKLPADKKLYIEW